MPADTTHLGVVGSRVKSIMAIPASSGPAAGVNYSITVPVGEQWEFRSLRIELLTSAVAANRRAALVIDDGTNIQAKYYASAVHAASLSIFYTWVAGLGYSTALLGTDILTGVPANMFLPSGWKISTLVDLFDPGDDFAIPRLVVNNLE